MTKRKPGIIPKYTEGWTPERVATLKKLWERGESASQIAAALGDVSRNGVIGKIHRLGLPGRTTTSRSIQSKKNRNGSVIRPTRVKPPTKPVKVASDIALPILRSLENAMKTAIAEPPAVPPPYRAGGVDLLDLKQGQCHRVINASSPWRYCARPVPKGSRREYCPECYDLMWVMPKGYHNRPRPERAMHEEEEQAA
jgi:GcrA cell cycle regulator